MVTTLKSTISAARTRISERDNDRDVKLLKLVATGDRRAFQQLYEFYHRRLAAFLVRLTRQHDIAEEVINDTMWIVWKKAAQFRGEAQVSTWIIGIAYRRALNTIQRLNSGVRALNQTVDIEALTSDEPERTDELHDWLGSALEQLPVEQRLVIELAYYMGHSCDEIAAIMDCPANTVKTRMFHARHKMKRLLEESADGA